MDLPRTDNSFLLKQFREFYREAVRLKRSVELNQTSPYADLLRLESSTPSQAASSAVTGVWQQLLSALERQALEAGQAGGAFAFEIYREAQYLMAALADEIFLHTNWEGRTSWPLLESRLFQSHVAGEAVFQRLDRLLQRRDPFYIDLAAVYFMALSLGFQGKYRGSGNTAALEQYRRQLFAMIYRRNPKLFTSSAPLFPQALQNVLDGGIPKKLPDQKVWLGLVAAVFIVWISAAQVAWSSVSSDVSCMMCQVLRDNCLCDASEGSRK